MSKKKLARGLLGIIVVYPNRVLVYDYDSNVLLKDIKHKENKSLSTNFNIGVKNCPNKYIVRIDGDDLVNASFLGFGFEYGILMLEMFRNIKAASPLYSLVSEGILIDKPQGAGIIYDREFFIKLGYDETIDRQADLDFYIRWLKKYWKYGWGYYQSIYPWNKGGRSSNLEETLKAREKILKKHLYLDQEIHHFGSYAYVK